MVTLAIGVLLGIVIAGIRRRGKERDDKQDKLIEGLRVEVDEARAYREQVQTLIVNLEARRDEKGA